MAWTAMTPSSQSWRGRGGYGSHAVSVASGTLPGVILGASEAPVPTHHHQAADRLGAA